ERLLSISRSNYEAKNLALIKTNEGETPAPEDALAAFISPVLVLLGGKDFDVKTMAHAAERAGIAAGRRGLEAVLSSLRSRIDTPELLSQVRRLTTGNAE